MDPRRWIYAGLDVLAALAYVAAIVLLVPNRHPSATVHMWLFPLAAASAAAGMFLGGPLGRRVALIAGGVWLGAVFLLIVRICVSAAFLAGTYGAFGKAASSFALLMVAIVIEAVGILPIVQVKYLMSRSERRCFG